VIEPVASHSQGARRRAHLMAVAANLIVTRGVDAVSHAAVAEQAGVARTLVYRYFPRREDLLYALFTAIEEEIDRRTRPEDFIASMIACKDATDGVMPDVTRKMFESLWPPEDWEADRASFEMRVAVAILNRDADIESLIGVHAARRQQRLFEERLRGPLRSLGLRDIEVELVIDALLSVHLHATRAVMEREITREEVVRLFFQVTAGMIQTFTR